MKITYGLKNLYYSAATVGEDGKVQYETPKRMPGATEISLSPVGEDTQIKGDDTTFVTITVNQGYDGNVSVLGIPEEFAVNVLGMTKDGNGVLVENAEDVKKQFALLGEFSSETKEKKRWVLYNCTAGRTDFAGKTKEDSVEAQTFSIPLKAAPAEDTGDVKAIAVGDPTAKDAPETFKNWFKAVYVSEKSVEEGVTE